jgi:hypothetical protein
MKVFSLFFILFSLNSFSNECSKDAKTLCPAVGPGKGQLARCLEDNVSRLSVNCARELKNFKAKTAKKNPCFEDLTDLCGELPAGAQNLDICLLKNESRLSETCLNDFRTKKSGLIIRNVCAQDVANVCYSEINHRLF